MFNKLFHRASRNAYFVADIGSASAAVAIVGKNADGTVLVTHGERQVLPYEDRPREQTVAAIVAKLNEIANRLLSAYAASSQSKLYGAPGGVFVLIRAPWSNSETVTAEQIYDRDIPIYEKTVAVIGKNAIEKSTTVQRTNIFETGIARIELNGYPVRKPRGLAAHSVTVTVLQSECDPALKQPVESALQALLPGRKIDLHSSTRALTAILRARAEARRKYLLIDMTSEASTFSIIKRDGITAHVSVPVGVRTILKQIDPQALPEETLTTLRLAATDSCTADACNALIASLAAAEPRLVKTFGDALASIATKGRLPNTLVLSVHPDMALWLSKFFTRLDFAQFTVTTRPFNITTLTPAHLSDTVQFAPGATPETGIAVAASLVNMKASG